MTTQIQTNRAIEPNNTTKDSDWKDLYKLGAVAALLTVVLYPIQVIVFIISPPPNSVIRWFHLLQTHWFVGLIDQDLLLIVDEVLSIIIFLALYIALRRFNEPLMFIAVTLGLLSTVLFIAPNPALAMLSLSRQYAAAVTDAQRTLNLSAGQALLANWQGSASQVGYILGSIAPIIISVVMLRSTLFSKVIAYLGILANVIALGAFVPKIGVYISVFSVLFLWIWNMLIARRFFQLGSK